MDNPRHVFAIYDEREGTYKYLMSDTSFESRKTADKDKVFLTSESIAKFICSALNASHGEECFGYMQIRS